MIGSKLDTLQNLIGKLLRPFGRLRIFSVWPDYFRFFSALRAYRKNSREKVKFADLMPMFSDRTDDQPFDKHYFYQGVWAFRKIKASNAELHVDVGGQIDLVGFLTTITRVEYVDIRVLEIKLPNYVCKKGSILTLPYADNSVKSLSCLHVAEHIGLGRYGDSIDPEGTAKACRELARVLSPGGNLYFSLPIGDEKICFNAHRIHAVKTILGYFSDLDLTELSSVTDDGEFIEDIDWEILDKSQYAAGFFHFVKPHSKKIAAEA